MGSVGAPSATPALTLELMVAMAVVVVLALTVLGLLVTASFLVSASPGAEARGGRAADTGWGCGGWIKRVSYDIL